MNTLYIDATLPLRWGLHPPVGIPRVETALIRQALRWKGSPVRFVIVDKWATGTCPARPSLTISGEGRRRDAPADRRRGAASQPAARNMYYGVGFRQLSRDLPQIKRSR